MTPFSPFNWATASVLWVCAATAARSQEQIESWAPAVPPGIVRVGVTPFTYTTPDGVRDTADAGAFRVPVDHVHPTKDSLTLVFVRLRSKATTPVAPIVYLAGGPGASGIDGALGAQMRFFEELREVGDVVLLDQRGTGRSEPDTRCEGRWDLPSTKSLNDAETIDALKRQVATCARYLRTRAVDLAWFTTPAIADDIVSLRQALGVPKVSLYGFSSGSHFALEAVRRHPMIVDRVVIGGVEGPGQTYKLPLNALPALIRLDRTVRADARISAYVPDLLALMDSVHQRLRLRPVMTSVPIRTLVRYDERGFWTRRGIDLIALFRPRYTVRLSEYDLQALLAIGLGRADLLTELPALYFRMSRGDYQQAALLSMLIRKGQEIGPAMGYAVDCADGVLPARADSIARQANHTPLGSAANWPFPFLCTDWGRLGDVPSSSRDPVTATIPVLIVNGTLDGRTSLEQAREAVRGLPAASFIEVQNVAHSDVGIFNTPEVHAAVKRFLRGGVPLIAKVTLDPLQFAPPVPVRLSLADTLFLIGKTQGGEALLAEYDRLRRAHARDFTFDFREPSLNTLGYRLVRTGHYETGIAVFRLNASLFPRSLNVYDSLGEGLLIAGRPREATIALNQAIALGFNPHSYVLLWEAKRRLTILSP